MKSRFLGAVILGSVLGGVLFSPAPAGYAATGPAPLRVLILSGQNNHDWSTTTPKLKSILTAGGRFEVEVTEHPEQCDAAAFSKYDALLSNWNTWSKQHKPGQAAVTNWPAATRQAFLDFVRGGKGLVVVHAGSSSFYDWPEYQQLTGASWKIDQTHHGKPHAFTVTFAAPSHPVMRGLEPFTTTDELWLNAGLHPEAKILATAFSDKAQGGTGRNEPVALSTEFGRGRCFTLLLGHSAAFMASPGFEALLRRGTEWAATGQVTAATTAP